MHQFIYYPGLEIRDELWLKFALLYLDKLAFVSNASEHPQLPRQVATLRQQTSLFSNWPSASLLCKSSEGLIQQLQSLLTPQFKRHKVFGNPELIQRWQQTENHDFYWPKQEGLDTLQHYCLEQSFASPAIGGICLPKRLANLLSMRIAHDWAQMEDHTLITDHDYLDRLLHLSESCYHHRTGYDCFHLDLQLKLPSQLHSVSFDELISLRNHKGYQQALERWLGALRSLLSSLMRGYSEPEKLGVLYQSIRQLELFLGPDCQTFTLTTIISSPLAAAPMIHSLQHYQQQNEDPRLIFHTIKKTHFYKRQRTQHFFTRLGPLRHATES